MCMCGGGGSGKRVKESRCVVVTSFPDYRLNGAWWWWWWSKKVKGRKGERETERRGDD